MRKLILGTVLSIAFISPALACPYVAGVGYEIDEWLSNGTFGCGPSGPSLASGGGGGAAPACHSQSCGIDSQQNYSDGGRTDALGVAAGVATTAAAVTGNKALGVIGGMLGFGAAVSNAADNGNIGISPQSVTPAPDSPGIGPGPSGEGD